MRIFFFDFCIIPTGSMIPTYQPGDFILINKLHKSFDRGDIVVFKHEDKLLIKRVQGIAGDVITRKDNNWYVNDNLISTDNEETYEQINQETEISFPYTVPTGYIWVCGDNNNDSRDSRFFGAIPIISIVSTKIISFK